VASPSPDASGHTVEEIEVLLEWESRLRKVRAYVTGFFMAFPDPEATEAFADMVEISSATVVALRDDLDVG
jgi:hypothetical protein